MADFYREVTKLLRQNLYRQVSGGKGSHEKWEHEKTGDTVIVPRTLKKRHTANGILKSALIDKKL
ncbi:MAG: type II toxin-antitoxin system HicA family toxin [Pseudomonadota bacterium]